MIDIKKKLCSIFAYIIAGIFIYDCRSMQSIAFKLGHLPNLLLVISILGSVIVSTTIISKSNLKRIALISLLFILYMSVYALFSVHRSVVFWLTTVILLFIWQIGLSSEQQQVPKILISYKNLVFIIAIISLIFWFLGSIFKIIHPSGVVMSSWGAVGNNLIAVPSYYNLYFETQTFRSGFSFLNGIQRNSAIFTEAPMASLNFSIALLIEYLNKHTDKWHKRVIAVLILAIMSTFSTTGYTLLIMWIFCILVHNKNFMLKNIRFIILPILLVAIIIGIKSLLTEKTNNNFSSVSVRLDDYKVGWQAWKQHKLFGIGIQNYKYLSQYMDSWRIMNLGFSNSVTDIFSGGGIYLALLYVLCFAKGLWVGIKRKNWKETVFVGLILYLFVTTFFTYTLILLYLLVWFAMGMSSSQKYNMVK